ncbi:hypothetical protein INT47_000879 [Mucor saturninus]|uniref:Uncharacterized protein n=1 Tax=Mucor saturninus TaxID=64648 RepID=A0A8H7RPK5_9FUNG|nr:hypothetical protein INT47_000879 [Mucor saturninus]
MIHNNHPLMKTTAAKCQHIKGILVNTFVMKKKKPTPPKEDEQDTLCPSICSSSDNDSNSLTSTLFLPDDSSVQQDEEEPQEHMYSNLYVRLPNGNWLVTYRTRDEKHLSSHEIESYMI